MSRDVAFNQGRPSRPPVSVRRSAASGVQVDGGALRSRPRRGAASHSVLGPRVAAAVLACVIGVVFGLMGAVRSIAPVVSEAGSDGTVTASTVATAFEVAVETPVAPVETVAQVVPTPAEVVVVGLRLVEARQVPITVGELYQGLSRSPWPSSLWPEVVRIARCEAYNPVGVNARAEGDSGRALGLLQIRVDAHPDLARDYDLLTVDGALAAAWVVYTRAGRSFTPWSCY